jgi:hypothetical protein
MARIIMHTLALTGGRVLSWRWARDPRRHAGGTDRGRSGVHRRRLLTCEPTTLLRDVGYTAAYSSATRDHSRILIRVSPDAAKDNGEIRLLFDWQDALRQNKHEAGRGRTQLRCRSILVLERQMTGSAEERIVLCGFLEQRNDH